jgi:hypothetical protein
LSGGEAGENHSMSEKASESIDRLIQLEHDVRRLNDEVAVLRAIVDPDDVCAAEEKRRNPVTNDQLRIWAQQSVIPDGLAERSEEKPW